MSAGIRDRAQGRWRSILPTLGIDRRYLLNKTKHGPCPICQAGKDRYRFDDKDGTGSWICNQCGAGDGFSLLMRVRGWDFKEVASQVEAIVGTAPREVQTSHDRTEKSLAEANNRLWRSGTLIQPGDVVAHYLERRGIVPSKFPAALRFVRECRYNGEPATYHPAMIAKVTGDDGKPVTIHRTYLTELGAKAAVIEPRKLMPGRLPKGAAIRLSEPAGTLGVAEGIETALSATVMWGIPCWAAINTAMLMAWEPPAITTEVYVFGDNDEMFGGHAAAYGLAHRLSAGSRRLKVRVEIPAEVGADWNDMLRAETTGARPQSTPITSST